MQRAIDLWSPVGGEVIEVYLKAPQTSDGSEPDHDLFHQLTALETQLLEWRAG